MAYAFGCGQPEPARNQELATLPTRCRTGKRTSARDRERPQPRDHMPQTVQRQPGDRPDRRMVQRRVAPGLGRRQPHGAGQIGRGCSGPRACALGWYLAPHSGLKSAAGVPARHASAAVRAGDGPGAQRHSLSASMVLFSSLQASSMQAQRGSLGSDGEMQRRLAEGEQHASPARLVTGREPSAICLVPAWYCSAR
jgi:hypothetical protein